MSAPPPPVPVPDAAGWVLVAGVSASLHLAAASAMVLALAGQPQAPVSGTAGIVIRNLPPVTGTTAEPGRAQHTAVTDRLRPLDDPAEAARAEAAEARIAAAPTGPVATDRPAHARLAPIETMPPEPEASRGAPVPATPDDPARLAPLGNLRKVPQAISAERASARLEPRSPAIRQAAPAAVAATPRRLEPDGAAVPRNEEAAALRAPVERAARTDQPSAAPAPLPREPERRPSRARRDGPDQRLSDRQAEAADRRASGPDLGRAQRLLQGLHDTPCHLVIRLQGGVPGLAALGRDPGLLAEAGKRLAETFVPEARPTLATHPVASGQCPVLDFARVAGDDPMRGIELDLWRPTVSDERPLAGTLLHDHPGSLHLLLADAAGQVHDLTGFLRPGPDGSDFLVPVSGSADGGRGLLVAIATPFPLESLRAHSGPRPTGRVFESLAAELAQLGMVPDLALAAFALE